MTAMPNRLDEIIAFKRRELDAIKRTQSISKLERAFKDRTDHRSFRKAIRQDGKLSLIAEFKRVSPSAGPIRPGADAVEVCRLYQEAGAAALSVLTDSAFFGGSLQDLTKVRQEVHLPVLRKDFILEEYQIVEAAAAGADALLLIVAALEINQLKLLQRLTIDMKMTPLVEVHSDLELNDALEAGATVIGINNRNLKTLEIDLTVMERLRRVIPPDKTVIGESGLRSRADVDRVRRLGMNAVLIGEELLSAPDIKQRVKEMMN